MQFARLIAWVLALAWTVSSSADIEVQRADFVAAERALAQSDLEGFTALAARLEDYPLYPYLRYAALNEKLHTLPRTEVRAFLERFDDTPLAWQLRSRWLNLLASKGLWQDFLADYRPTSNVSLQCRQLQALIQTGNGDAALPRVEALWLHGSSRPKACDAVFEHWLRAGNPGRELAWKRIALAMDAGNPGLARYLRRFLPASEQAWADYWMNLHRDPAQLTRRDAPGTEHPYLRRIQAHTVRRLAGNDPHAALTLWQEFSTADGFTEGDKQRVHIRLAAALFDQPGDEADRFFDELAPRSADRKLHELRLRAALARGDWEAYLRWHASMPPALRDEPRWQYWLARALDASGEAKAAHAIYQRLAEQRSYHGFLAADRIGVGYSLSHSTAPAATEDLARLAATPAMQRSHELLALGRTLEARREWHLATRNLSEAELVTAAKLADSWEWHGQAILTVAEGRHWDDLELRFPLAHRDTVEQQAGRQALDPAWIYAVVRQESAFMADARSHVGATGLMQLMPATARRVARRLEKPLRINSTRLRQPEVNITLGSAYLREVLDDLFSNPVLATAAYNAGPHRVRQWLPETPMAGDLWVEMVPFYETRKYLKRVLTYTAIYQARMGREPTRLLERMPTVQPAEVYARSTAAGPGSS
jgi:soluble lytic murein transglycosylase